MVLRMFISSTINDTPSTKIRSPTSKGCIMKRKIRDSNVLRAALPKTNTEGSNIEENATNSFWVFTPIMRKQIVSRMAKMSCATPRQAVSFLHHHTLITWADLKGWLTSHAFMIVAVIAISVVDSGWCGLEWSNTKLNNERLWSTLPIT